MGCVFSAELPPLWIGSTRNGGRAVTAGGLFGGVLAASGNATVPRTVGFTSGTLGAAFAGRGGTWVSARDAAGRKRTVQIAVIAINCWGRLMILTSWVDEEGTSRSVHLKRTENALGNRHAYAQVNPGWMAALVAGCGYSHLHGDTVHEFTSEVGVTRDLPCVR